MANIFKPEELLLVLDLTTRAGRIAAKTFGFAMLLSDEEEHVRLARKLLKELDKVESSGALCN